MLKRREKNLNTRKFYSYFFVTFPLDFDSINRVVEPDHFQCTFLILGFIFYLWLFVLMLDILNNSSLGFFKLMLGGLLSCGLVTFVNLYFFDTSLWTHITYDKPERRYHDSFDIEKIATPAKSISTGEYEYDMEAFVRNKTYCLAILGYGAVTSFIFIFVAMMRSLGKTHFLLIIYI